MKTNNDNVSVAAVDRERWEQAQSGEMQIWIRANQNNSYLKLAWKFVKALKQPRKLVNYIKFSDYYCGDDWNYWWLQIFDNYRALPERFSRALEVGSGPYSNIRIVQKLRHIDQIVCSDPLMEVYKTFPLTWVAAKARAGKIQTVTGMAERIEFPDQSFDLVVCINVLDHVQDAGQCLSEIRRVLKPNGYFVFGQELSDEEDVENPVVKQDVCHPIKLHEKFVSDFFQQGFAIKFQNNLQREEGRETAVRTHCATCVTIASRTA